MTRRYFSGSTLDQAIMLAARHHGIDPEELAYRRIEKRHGFLRSRKSVMIEVDPERPRRKLEPIPIAEAQPPQAQPPRTAAQPPPARPAAERRARPETPRPPGESGLPAAASVPRPAAPGPEVSEARAATMARERPDDELLAAAERATEILLRFAGIEAEATARPGDERIEVEVEGADDAVLLVEGGKGLLAIQHLLPRMLRGLTGRTSFVRVDSGGFHAERKERLETLARREAEAVRRQGRARTLAPMAPDERRIVHLALADDVDVETESRGGGLHKRIVIRPVGRPQDDADATHEW